MIFGGGYGPPNFLGDCKIGVTGAESPAEPVLISIWSGVVLEEDDSIFLRKRHPPLSL